MKNNSVKNIVKIAKNNGWNAVEDEFHRQVSLKKMGQEFVIHTKDSLNSLYDLACELAYTQAGEWLSEVYFEALETT